MDTISRENNSYLPIAGVLVGVLALVLSGVALAKISSAKKEISSQVEPLSLRIDEAEAQARNAAASAEKAASGINKLASDTQSAFTQVAQERGNIRGEITKVQEARAAGAIGWLVKPFKPEKLLEVVPAEKILFGSDFPDLPVMFSMAPILYARISDQDKRRILGQTAREIIEKWPGH